MVLAVLFSGCATGGVFVQSDITVGNPVSDDTVKGYIRVAAFGNKKTYDQAWNDAIVVIQKMGVISTKNKEDGLKDGLIEADIRGGEVKVLFKYIDSAFDSEKIEISVSARKYDASDIELAQDVYNRIIEKIRYLDNKPQGTMFVPMMM